MRIIILDMQSQLYAGAIRRVLAQDIGGDNIVIMKTPEETPGICRVMQPYALMMEVTGYSPWMLSERLNICDWVRRDAKGCKIVLVVDEKADKKLAEQVKDAKKQGLIDAFLFTSATESYLAAVMDSL